MQKQVQKKTENEKQKQKKCRLTGHCYDLGHNSRKKKQQQKNKK
jgi:hypothetical protein